MYWSYLFRIWREEGDGSQWRFSLEDTRTGKRWGFTSLVKLMGFLDKLTDLDSQISLEDE
jgi:hypothetical protein